MVKPRQRRLPRMKGLSSTKETRLKSLTTMVKLKLMSSHSELA
jgi:hypothetical protein